EAARKRPDGLDLEGHVPREVDAKEPAAVRLGHPSRLRDAAPPEPAVGAEGERERSEESLPPEGEAGALPLASDLLEARPDDGPADHQLRDEDLARERAELSSRRIEGDAVQGSGPVVG